MTKMTMTSTRTESITDKTSEESRQLKVGPARRSSRRGRGRSARERPSSALLLERGVWLVRGDGRRQSTTPGGGTFRTVGTRNTVLVY